MTSRWIQRLASSAAWLSVLAFPAYAENPCTGPPPFEVLALGADESGIGGTGHGDPDSESGIGGTGFGDDESGIGGTGIYGTLTGFGSVCVNGLRIHHAPDVEVEVNGRPGTASDLSVGQVVYLVATPQDGALRTERIGVFSAVVGRVESIDREAGALRVEGRRIRVAPGTRFADGASFALLAVGDFIDISGIEDEEGTIVASRLERADDDAPGITAAPSSAELLASSGVERVSIEAYMSGRADRLDVAGLRVDLAERSDLASRVRPGIRVRAVGRMLPTGVLRIDRPQRPDRPRAGGRPVPRPAPKPRSDRDVRPDRVDRPDRPARPERPERPERPDISDRVERPVVKDLQGR